MSNAAVFLSSTCYDLSVVRAELDRFLTTMSIDVLNSERSSFGVTPGVHSHAACIEQVGKADILLLIIGGRRGGTYVGSERSITNEEYNAAAKLGLPRIVCVQKSVLGMMKTWKKNPGMDLSGTVDDVRIFDFVDYIRAEATDNWIFPFEEIKDIKTVLTSQFAHYLHLFSQQKRVSTDKEKSAQAGDLVHVEFPSQTEGLGDDMDSEEQTSFRNGLRAIHGIVVSILTSEMKNDVKKECVKNMWVIAKYGELTAEKLEIDNDVFKPYAWSVQRGRRVFTQLGQFGVACEYDEDYGDGKLWITMCFNGETEEVPISWALKQYVDDLVSKYGQDAFDFFLKADMRIYMG